MEANGRRKLSSSILTLKKTLDVGVTGTAASATKDVSSFTAKSVKAAKADLEGFKHEAFWPRHAISLNLRMNDGKLARPFDISTVAAASRTFNEIVVVAVLRNRKDDDAVAIDGGNALAW